MSPEIYSYKKEGPVIELSIFPIAIESCLGLFDEGEKLRLIEFGATCYKNYGWVDHNHFKEFNLVSDLCHLLETEGDIGISICHAVVGDWCTLIANDDGRAVFQVNTEKDFNSLLGKLAGPYASLVTSQVKKYAGQFIKVGSTSNVEKYSSIKQYSEGRA